MGKIILGIVADDFTGGSDAASFLAEEGIKTILYNGIPNESLQYLNEDIAVVIALKTRTEEKNKAVAESLKAFQWLKENKAKQLYSKYCSTFDSTDEGNIGPIIDRVLEDYNINYTIIAPALPINGRIVKNGHLIVNGIPLHETHMRNHPLTPMKDSKLSNLISRQGKYPSLEINQQMLGLSKEEILGVITDFGKDKEHFYVIPDYTNDSHAVKIVELFGELPLLTGGSGLMTELALKYNKTDKITKIKEGLNEGKTMILAGSCSVATLQQIAEFKNHNGNAIKIDPAKIIDKTQTIEGIWQNVINSGEDSILIYSSDTTEKIKEAQQHGIKEVSELLEQTIAIIARKALENGYNKIIVAGGETSGAVTKSLGYHSYLIGNSIAPGVPIMTPIQNKDVRLVLKSGNFGDKDFFIKAVNMIGSGSLV